MASTRHSVAVRLSGPGAEPPSMLKPQLRMAILEPPYVRLHAQQQNGVQIVAPLGISVSMARGDLAQAWPAIGHARGTSAASKAVSASAEARIQRVAARRESSARNAGQCCRWPNSGKEKRRAGGLAPYCRKCTNKAAQGRRDIAKAQQLTDRRLRSPTPAADPEFTTLVLCTEWKLDISTSDARASPGDPAPAGRLDQAA